MWLKITFTNGGFVEVQGEGEIKVDFTYPKDEIKSLETHGMDTTFTQWENKNGTQKLGEKVGKKNKARRGFQAIRGKPTP